jgi:osmotically-inducible protein OsmY
MASEAPHDEPKQYLIARIQEALAKDGRVNELDIDVVLAGHKIFLSGEVTTARRKEAISEIARECLPGYEVVNEVNISPFGASEPESLS